MRYKKIVGGFAGDCYVCIEQQTTLGYIFKSGNEYMYKSNGAQLNKYDMKYISNKIARLEEEETCTLKKR